MSIHVILGKPGSGKSLYAVSMLIRELIDTERNIVTNLPLRLDRLNEYLQQKHPNVCTRFVERVRVLSDEQLREFWKYRAPDDIADPGKGVAYFLDEAHIAFNARDWATIGRGALHYLSQHRKLGDIVWVITQAPGNLDKQFRSVAEDFTALRNEYTAKYGIFRGRGRFVRRTYLSEPQPNAEPFEVATFTLDKEGIASCYDTAKGIGVHGSKADIGRRAKGIPIWWVMPAALVFGLSCFALPWLFGRMASRYLNPKSAKAIQPPSEQPKDSAATALLKLGATPAGPSPAAAPSQPAEQKYPKLPGLLVDDAPAKPLWVVGYLLSGRKINVYLSDGRVYTEHDRELEKVERNAVTIRGERIFIRRSTNSERSQ